MLGLTIALIAYFTDPPINYIRPLLNLFEKYARACYPKTEIKKTKRSIKLKYESKIDYELVPMLATDDDEEQIIISSDGERHKTSVQGHVKFTKSRTEKSMKQKGRVQFNDCVRLFKWWKDYKANCEESFHLRGNNSPPSFLIDLLCAKAFDQLSVYETYTETLAKWFAYLVDITQHKKAVYFTSKLNKSYSLWSVIDPMNEESNIVEKWDTGKIEELASWFAEARDILPQVIRYDRTQDDAKGLQCLEKLFGSAFRHHCE